MVVFVDYDNPLISDSSLHSYSYIQPGKASLTAESSSLSPHPAGISTDDNHQGIDPSTNQSHDSPNQDAFSAALNCYPIITEIARSIDLNTLHALSRTCRQFHANIAPFGHQLAKQTLRCENEYIETLSDLLDSGFSIPDSVKSILMLLSQRASVNQGRLTRGKVGRCARDMVSECRRCSKVVCRNCTIKSPSSSILKNRIRRLCVTCRTAPLACLTPSPADADFSDFSNPPATAAAFMRTPCSCDTAVWLCYHCGQTLRSEDTTYRRVWTWRTRYSTYLGGLGTGIGEGSQGVKCGRGGNCLAAQDIEMEVDCEADDSPHYLSHRDEEQPGYFRQEIVGIGGVVKQKAKKRVTVGDCVVEYEDERESGQYLVREEEGAHRSWCGWCWRVIPAKDERVGFC